MVGDAWIQPPLESKALRQFLPKVAACGGVSVFQQVEEDESKKSHIQK
jgi:hypothetical protein